VTFKLNGFSSARCETVQSFAFFFAYLAAPLLEESHAVQVSGDVTTVVTPLPL
jgi:hypothetical protein